MQKQKSKVKNFWEKILKNDVYKKNWSNGHLHSKNGLTVKKNYFTFINIHQYCNIEEQQLLKRIVKITFKNSKHYYGEWWKLLKRTVKISIQNSDNYYTKQ